LHFDAVSGRSNNITVFLDIQDSSGYPPSVLLRDTRNVVAAGPGCTRVDVHTVRCDKTTIGLGIVGQDIRLGDADDTFASSVWFGSQTTVDAGAGNDTVNGGPSENWITAGTGNDTVNGEAGYDSLIGGAGFDALDGGTDMDYCDVRPGGGTTVNCETGP
jgi:Ca2+-binding RTX toxin-like protein